MPTTPLGRFTASTATAFAAAVLCVFPLYIDRFSNLGITKYTTGFTLVAGFVLFILACLAVGARVPKNRFANAKKDYTLWGLAAFVAATLLSTVLSLSPLASVFGLGSYYGGLTLVLYTAAGYLALRAFARVEDLSILQLGIGATTIIVTVLYVLNIFNIDLIGAYENTAVVERAQFFSTLGQKDFNAAFMAVALPLVFYAFLAAQGAKRTILFAVPAVFGALALAVVDSEGLTLGMAAAVAIMICHKDFDAAKLRRAVFLVLCFFLWAAWMYYMRSTVYTQGGTSLLSCLGKPSLAVPGVLLCAAAWAALWLYGKYGRGRLRLWLAGRVLVAAGLALAAALFVLANCVQGFPSIGKLDSYIIFNDDWGTYRGTAWRIAWCSWAEGGPLRWLFGFGPGMMHNAVAAWAGADITERMNTFYAAHNEYLEQLISTGIFGLAAWVCFVAASLKRGFANWRKPGVAPVLLALCSYLTHALVSIRVSMLFPQVMLLFALLSAQTAPQPEAAPAEPAAKPAAKQGKRKKRKPQGQPQFEDARREGCLRYIKITAAAVLSTAAAGAVAPLLFSFLYY